MSDLRDAVQLVRAAHCRAKAMRQRDYRHLAGHTWDLADRVCVTCGVSGIDLTRHDAYIKDVAMRLLRDGGA